MTETDRKNLAALIRRAARRSDNRDWMALYAAERYYGLITCAPYVGQVRALVDEVA